MSPGKSFLGQAFQHAVFDAKFFAVRSFFRPVAVFVDGVNVRPDAFDFGFCVQPTMTGRDQCLFDEADCLNHVTPLICGKQGVSFAFEEPDVGIVSHNNVKIAQNGDFFEKSHVA